LDIGAVYILIFVLICRVDLLLVNSYTRLFMWIYSFDRYIVKRVTVTKLFKR